MNRRLHGGRSATFLAVVTLLRAVAAQRPAFELNWWLRDYTAARVAERSCAICIAGELRTFAHERVRANWEGAVLRPLRPDVFMDVSADSSICTSWNASLAMTGPNRKKGGCIEREAALAPAQLRALAAWLEPLGLVQMQVRTHEAVLDTYASISPRVFVTAAQSARVAAAARALRDSAAMEFPSARCAPGAEYTNVVRLTLALRWLGCLRGIERAERTLRRGAHYDWVVRSRPDYTWSCVLTPPPLPINPCGKHVVGENDFMWLAPRGLAGSLLSLYRFHTPPSGRPLALAVGPGWARVSASWLGKKSTGGALGTRRGAFAWPAGKRPAGALRRAEWGPPTEWALNGRACPVRSCHEHSACFDFAALSLGALPHSTCAARGTRHAAAKSAGSMQTPAPLAPEYCVDNGLHAKARASGFPPQPFLQPNSSESLARGAPPRAQPSRLPAVLAGATAGAAVPGWTAQLAARQERKRCYTELLPACMRPTPARSCWEARRAIYSTLLRASLPMTLRSARRDVTAAAAATPPAGWALGRLRASALPALATAAETAAPQPVDSGAARRLAAASAELLPVAQLREHAAAGDAGGVAALCLPVALRAAAAAAAQPAEAAAGVQSVSPHVAAGSLGAAALDG